MTDQECRVCRFVESSPAGGWIHDDEHWRASVMPGLEIPGWIIVALRRHAVGATAMTPGEASSLGPVVADLTSAIQSATGAERVYLLAYGEELPHWHVLLAARGAHVPSEHRYAAFWDHRAEYVDPARAEEAAGAIRTARDAAVPA